MRLFHSVFTSLLLYIAKAAGDNDGVYEQPLLSYRDAYYGTILLFGTKPQQQAIFLTVAVGRELTANPKIKVPAATCVGCCSQRLSATYNESKSTTFKKDKTVKSSIGSGIERVDRGWETVEVSRVYFGGLTQTLPKVST